MTEEANPQNNPDPRKADQTQPEKPRRRKKAPPIDFNALNDRDNKLLQSIATTGARVAGRQQKVREGQLNAMKDTLADILVEPDNVDSRSMTVLFKLMLAYATPANAKKIASTPLCPPDLPEPYRHRA
ncbi:hypothetical protein JSE7799_02667 [Jannaschia seosinensis]|uniref:Uncharacterized protein n=1 Tax=Jannaschia seosinensis TaxID=313367 RepID=A0A0M7BCM2_9RHOB|nr:hypothetical protein [Jannaschia seosinensis]CUH39939.1 hypothetical protein JSE7799_02667 [Jannaschia seosinensis]